MALTGFEKMNIMKYLKEHAMGDIYYGNMRDTLGRRRDKVTDVEFLDYFVEYLASEFRKSDKIYITHLTKVVSCVDAILDWVYEGKQDVSEETIDKIRSFKDFYEEYLERTGVNRDDEFYETMILPVVEKVNKLYPSEEVNESLSKYIGKIAALNITIGKLEKELAEALRLQDVAKSDNEKKDRRIDSLMDDVRALEKNVRGKEQEILELSETISELRGRVEELSAELSQVTEANGELSEFKAKYEELVGEVSRLQNVIDEDIKARTAETELQIKHSTMEALMYQKMLFDRIDVDGLLRYLKENGMKTDRSEVVEVLNGMKKVVTLDSSVFSTQPGYKVIQPTLKEDGTFTINVPYGCKHYDVVLTADMHIKDVDGKVLRSYDALIDYCTKNNIHLVLSLGDFFHGVGSYQLDYENAVGNRNVIEKTISDIPAVDGIYYGILGGNHDKNISRYGFDPIKMLSEGREDFLDLGYTHSTVTINSPTSYLGCFDIHHPNDFDFPVDLDDDGIDLEYMNGYLNDIYARQGRDRNDSYIDILGHTHHSQFNYPGGYCYIPEFIDGANKRGACHLRIYFDEDTDIKYMVFMPLSYSTATRLSKNNEIVYQKVKK